MSLPAASLGVPESRDASDDSTNVSQLPSQNETRTEVDESYGAQHCTNTTPITYLYLTFDTPLPMPNTTHCTSTISQTAPADLDLQPFTNPTQWPAHRKAYHLVICCIATLLTAYCAGAYSPPVAIMEATFDASRPAVLTGITTFCAGFALAPMVLAPFSEINGRYPVFAVSGVLFVVFQIVCGLVPDLAGMLVSRFIVGVGGSVFSTMVGGVIADLWDKEGRNTPMALFSGSVLVGTGLGPLISSVMVWRFGDDGEKWKWVFWHQAIMGGALMVLIIVFLKESRGSVVLSRKAKALNKWYEARDEAGYCGVWLRSTAVGAQLDGTMGAEDEENRAELTADLRLERVRWRVAADEERASLGKMISISVYRPFHLLFTEPVVFSFSLWVSFAWAVLYLTFASIPYVFETVYGWNMEQAGYIFGAMLVGAVLSTIIGVSQDSLLQHPQWRAKGFTSDDSSCENSKATSTRGSRFYSLLRQHFPAESPESRLYFTCLTATLLPIGLFIFGFTSTRSIHWIVPTMGVCLASMGIYSVYLATFNYLADVYQMYASSALAAQSCCRNILGGVFPLVTLPLFENLGNARAGGLLGGIALVLTFVPWVLVFFGPKIRARSSFAVKLEKAG